MSLSPAGGANNALPSHYLDLRGHFELGETKRDGKEGTGDNIYQKNFW